MEETLLAEVVFPDQISCSFADVGGHVALKRTLFDSVILPLQQSELFEQLQGRNNLLAVPSGILFYGPPGTGKTLVAKAIAKTTKCTFINVRPSTLQNKWFGESQKLIRALFSLANKLAPSIIFIDEADSFMRKRGAMQQDHEAAASMRAEFLALCDGLLTDPQKGKSVTVLACTNRPFDLDEAFLRRLPRTFLFDLPTLIERGSILQTFLSTHRLSEDVTVEKIAALTDKYSGSDLKEVCKIAAARPLRRLIKKHMKGEYERVMASKGSSEAASASSSAAASSEADSRHAVMEPGTASPDSSLSSADAAVLAAAGLSSSSSATLLALSNSRPIRLSDFRHAIHSIRPTGVEMLARLKQFEAQHRVGTAAAAEPMGDSDERRRISMARRI
jgi:SpoVK/Ycf46/Vps4 family AAA+-type ATPase